MEQAPQRLEAMDGVRGLAICLVLWTHVFPFEGSSRLAHLLMVAVSPGWVGVQLFFVLSGFLLTGILVEERGTPGFFSRFYIRRALRIFPLYFVFLAVYSNLVSLRPPLGGVCYWTYTSNYPQFIQSCAQLLALAPLWSLSVEEQFYLLLPATVAICPRRLLPRVLAVVAFVSVLLRAALVIVFQAATPAYTWTPSNLDGFALGGLLALGRLDPEGMARIRRLAPFVFASALSFFVGLGLGNRSFLPMQHSETSLVLGVTASVFFSAALVGLALTDERVARVLSGRTLRFFGKYSYAIYIFHLPISEAFRSRLSDSLGTSRATSPLVVLFSGLATIALAVMLAMATWRGLEAPALRLKEKLAPRWTTPPLDNLDRSPTKEPAKSMPR